MIAVIRRALAAVLSGVAASFGLLHAYGLPFDWNCGPSARWWESVRRRLSRIAGRFDDRAGPRPVTDAEFAGSTDRSLAAFERRLWRTGFVRNPLSRLKTRGGRPEAGSWAYRDSPLARRQLHLMLFARDDGGVDVYAHEEPSSVNPALAATHFAGRGQSVAAGVERARARFSLDAGDAAVDPVDGPWDAQPDVDGVPRR
ncbi:hypothetical protein [Haloplanus halobius]|uniref:hypothetical protein n=1 Tax=Haloplanus halobius TaxID=2934938 RepID=UPI00200EEE99|nr:hypothetical protein [Haloplanus sp. XH21]